MHPDIQATVNRAGVMDTCRGIERRGVEDIVIRTDQFELILAVKYLTCHVGELNRMFLNDWKWNGVERGVQERVLRRAHLKKVGGLKA